MPFWLILLAIFLLVPLNTSGTGEDPTEALRKSLAEGTAEGTASPQSMKAQLAAGADPSSSK